jgi:CcmD family protein
MLFSILQQAPAETTRYMIAGYAVIFTVMLLYVLSLVVRRRNLERDLETLKELETKEK